ncbi:MAG: sensor domain-containing diguanylate cyclase [Pontibacterium sp.]
MNLKPRFMLLIPGLFLLSAAIVWGLVQQLSESIVEEWAIRYAEKQVLYDKSRTLQPIIREMALAQQFASSERLIAWAKNPQDPDHKKAAIAEMERFRKNFKDQNYFVAFLKTGDYYYNNAANDYAGKQHRYNLQPERPADRWFYHIIDQNRDLHVNVNPDAELGVTKLWIDVLLRDQGDIAGVVGTGLDLTDFINHVVIQQEPGITNIYTDHDGAIQLHRDQTLIDFASITKAAADKKTFTQLLNNPDDQRAIQAIMKDLEHQPDRVLTQFVSIDGKKYLAGIAYLPEIGWFDITLLDIAVVLPASNFTAILLTFAIMFLLALWIVHFALNHYVIQPLKHLEHATTALSEGQCPGTLKHHHTSGEIGRLMSNFHTMALSIQNAKTTLEQQVQERTRQLEAISQTDHLTGLLNRRGMQARLDKQLHLFKREARGFGLIWFDVDEFKQINDCYGHGTGDKVLVQLSGQIQDILRDYDYASRWGGDEFLVLVQTSQPALLTQLAERIRLALFNSSFLQSGGSETPGMTVSAGSYFVQPGDTVETMLSAADHALYQAKAKGRNCHCSANKPVHKPEKDKQAQTNFQ